MAVISKSQGGPKVQTEGNAALHLSYASYTLKVTNVSDKKKKNVEQLMKITQSDQSEKVYDSSSVSNLSSLYPMSGIKYNVLRGGIESLPQSVCKPPKRVANMFKAGVAERPAILKDASAAPVTPFLSEHESKLRVSKKVPLANFLSKHQNKPMESSRMLVTVNISGSAGPLRFLVDTKDPVSRIIDLSLRAYAKEGRLPQLGINSKLVDLYCLNRDFEALDPEQSVGSLGTRVFLLHKRRNEELDDMAGKIERMGGMPWKLMWSKMNRVISSH